MKFIPVFIIVCHLVFYSCAKNSNKDEGLARNIQAIGESEKFCGQDLSDIDHELKLFKEFCTGDMDAMQEVYAIKAALDTVDGNDEDYIAELKSRVDEVAIRMKQLDEVYSKAWDEIDKAGLWLKYALNSRHNALILERRATIEIIKLRISLLTHSH